MTLDTSGREIGGLNGITTLAGANSELIVRSSTGPNFHDFTTRDLTMGAGTLLNLADNGRVRTGYLTSSGVIFGRGTVHMQGMAPGASLVNNGTISGSGNGGLTILQEGSGRFDLDGTSGNGQLTLAAPFSQLTFQGDTLADAFGGTVTMGSGSLLNMNMSNGWTADATSTFNVSSIIVGAAAQIDGGHFTFGGDLCIGGSQGHLRLLADITITPTADVFLGTDDRLEFDGTTAVNGGTFELSHGSQINFDGPTVISGGAFSMAGPESSSGVVNFNGETEWSRGRNVLRHRPPARQRHGQLVDGDQRWRVWHGRQLGIHDLANPRLAHRQRRSHRRKPPRAQPIQRPDSRRERLDLTPHHQPLRPERRLAHGLLDGPARHRCPARDPRHGFKHGGEGREIAVRASQLTLRPATRVDVNANSTVMSGSQSFASAVLIEGGTFDVGTNASLIFYGATEIRGGVFTTAGTGSAEGFINFLGETQWRGNVTINGTAHQSANATVTAPSVINATAFDMDGTSGDTVWNINSSLVVNAQRLDDFSSRFDGTMDIDSGVLGGLTIHLADPSSEWQMNGTMNLAGSGALPVTRVAGSRMLVTGDLNVTSGIAQITADTAFSSNISTANVTITQNATLRMRGRTVVGADTIFTGTGTLQNGIGGEMELESGTTLSQVGLINNSLMRIATDAPGIASVGRFLSTANAVWQVEIGGLVAGAQYDVLLISGGLATLGGTLDVSLIGLNDGSIFAPNIGDEFTFIFALGGVSGTFINDPITHSGGLTYEWTVIYNPNSVVLRLDNVVPTPGSVALLGLGGLIAARRRRA